MKIDITTLITSIGISLLAFIAPIQLLILSVGVLVLFDTLCGLYRAYKLEQDITSKKLSHVISKLLLYNVAIISGYIMQLMIGGDLIPVAKIIAVGIGMVELKSISESVDEVTGINIFKFVTNLIKRNSDSLSQTISETLPEDKK